MSLVPRRPAVAMQFKRREAQCGFKRPAMAKRPDTVFAARRLEFEKRYEEMAYLMKHTAEISEELSFEEELCLEVAYRKAVGGRLAIWRLASYGAGCKKMMEEDLRHMCKEFLSLVDDKLSKTASDESKAFYHRMKGHYSRLIDEIDHEADTSLTRKRSQPFFGKDRMTQVAYKLMRLTDPETEKEDQEESEAKNKMIEANMFRLQLLDFVDGKFDRHRERQGLEAKDLDMMMP